MFLLEFNLDVDAIVKIVGSLLLLVLTHFFNQAHEAKKLGQHEDQLGASVLALTQRAYDKLVLEFALARSPNSEGGLVITTGELSLIRARTLEQLLNELEGPVLKYAQGRGAEVLKGLIGRALNALIKQNGIEVVAGPVPASVPGTDSGPAAGDLVSAGPVPTVPTG